MRKASNGSRQGLLMRKLAVNDPADVGVMNSSLAHGQGSRVWLMKGRLRSANTIAR